MCLNTKWMFQSNVVLPIPRIHKSNSPIIYLTFNCIQGHVGHVFIEVFIIICIFPGIYSNEGISVAFIWSWYFEK